MRLFIELFALVFAILTIHRRLIQPFMSGMQGAKKTTQNFSAPSAPPIHSAAPTIDPKKIQDAEFEEIK